MLNLGIASSFLFISFLKVLLFNYIILLFIYFCIGIVRNYFYTYLFIIHYTTMHRSLKRNQLVQKSFINLKRVTKKNQLYSSIPS